MTRFRRCKTLGENYSQEAIVERIAKEDLSFTSHRMRKTGSDSKVLCQKIPQGEDVRLAEKILCKALPDWKAEKEAIQSGMEV